MLSTKHYAHIHSSQCTMCLPVIFDTVNTYLPIQGTHWSHISDAQIGGYLSLHRVDIIDLYLTRIFASYWRFSTWNCAEQAISSQTILLKSLPVNLWSKST
eukprot:367939_1